MSVKGQEFPAYDCARHPGHGPGLRHLQPRRLPPARLHRRLRSAGHPGQDRPAGDRRQARSGEGLPGRHRGVRLRRACASSPPSPGPWPTCSRRSQAACEGEFTLENLSLIGERIWNMEREFNNSRRLHAKDDDNLPPRLTDRAGQDRPGQGPGQRLPEMLPKYYEAARLGHRRPCRRRRHGAPRAVRLVRAASPEGGCERLTGAALASRHWLRA